MYKIVEYVPLRACAGICTWNGTHVLAAWKMAAALATGYTFVLKTSEKSSLGRAAYGELIREVGLPPGIMNILAGDGKVGAMLAGHMQIAEIAFYGQFGSRKSSVYCCGEEQSEAS